MVDYLFNSFSEALTGNIFWAAFGAFGWGILSILLSPCHLSSIPLIIGYISSRNQGSAGKSFSLALVFSLGIFITITIIGVITASLGRLVGDVGSTINYLIAVVFLIIGLYLLDVIKLEWNSFAIKGTKSTGLTAALILGLIFGIGVGPRTFAYMAPVLGVVFETAQTNILFTAVILLAFGLGHCSIIVAAGFFTGKVQSYLNWSSGNKTIIWVKRCCGVLVILGGLYQIYNTYTNM